MCFGYGVVHTLGPGHGKAVVVAYFLDSTRPRAWIEGVFAGAWIAFTHTLAALLLAGALKLFATVGLLGALREVRNVEMVSYLLILVIGFWRLWAGITGRVHEHHQAMDMITGMTMIMIMPRSRPSPSDQAAHARRLAAADGRRHRALRRRPGRDPAVDRARRRVGGRASASSPSRFGMAITLSAIGMASMVAHRLIIGDGRSQEIGRFTAIAASLIVIATAGTLLLGSLERFFR